MIGAAWAISSMRRLSMISAIDYAKAERETAIAIRALRRERGSERTVRRSRGQPAARLRLLPRLKR